MAPALQKLIADAESLPGSSSEFFNDTRGSREMVSNRWAVCVCVYVINKESLQVVWCFLEFVRKSKGSAQCLNRNSRH